jgi:hypothetical protein
MDTSPDESVEELEVDSSDFIPPTMYTPPEDTALSRRMDPCLSDDMTILPPDDSSEPSKPKVMSPRTGEAPTVS